jgi:hypothetical protein
MRIHFYLLKLMLLLIVIDSIHMNKQQPLYIVKANEKMNRIWKKRIQ